LRLTENTTVPLAGDALGLLLGGWPFNDIPRSAFDPFAALVRWVTGRRPNGGDSAEAIERAFEDLWCEVRQKPEAGAAAVWDQPFLSFFYTDRHRSYRKGLPLCPKRCLRPRQFAAVRAEPGTRDEEPGHSAHVLSGGFYSPIFIL
jgi:hypothetical protein